MLQSMKKSRYTSAVKLHNEWREVRAGTLRKGEGKQVNNVADERELKTSVKKPDDLTFLTQEWNRAGKKVAQKLTHWQLGWCRGPLDQPQISRYIFVKLWSEIKTAPCGPGPLPNKHVFLKITKTESKYSLNSVFLTVRNRLCSSHLMNAWMDGWKAGWLGRLMDKGWTYMLSTSHLTIANITLSTNIYWLFQTLH